MGNNEARKYLPAPVPKGNGGPKGKVGRPKGKAERYPGCNVRESRFIDEYLENPSNATQAAIRAGYSPSCANVIAWQKLRNERVMAILEQKRQELGRATFVGTARIMSEEGAIAFSDIRDYPEFGNLGIPDSLAPAISSIRLVKITKTNRDGTVEEREEHHVSLWPKSASLERLERMHGMFEKDNLQRPGGTTNVQVNQINNITIDLSDFTDEELAAIEAAWERKKDRAAIDVEAEVV